MIKKIIDGRAFACDRLNYIKEYIEKLASIYDDFAPSLAVIILGDDPASHIYVKNKVRICKEVGIKSYLNALPGDTSEQDLLQLISELSNNKKINGMLVQLPLPKHIHSGKIIDAINPNKDVDGFHPQNIASLYLNRKDAFVPCTPLGCLSLLQKMGVPLQGAHAAIVGRSNIVGKPLAMTLLLKANCSVSMLHSHSKNPQQLTRQADIVISAAGVPSLITPAWVKEGAIVIDVGMNRSADGKLQGDADFDALLDKVSHITPVPGGIGPMTIAGLMENCYQAAIQQHPQLSNTKVLDLALHGK